MVRRVRGEVGGEMSDELRELVAEAKKWLAEHPRCGGCGRDVDPGTYCPCDGEASAVTDPAKAG